MSFWAWLVGSNREAKIAQLAETLAARSVPGTIGRLSKQVQSMGLHEARGYIRARARLAVSSELAAAQHDSAFAQLMAAADDFTELVMDAVIRRVQHELHRRRMQVQAVPVRRAA